MKIGILIDRLNVGGVEKIAVQEVRALKEMNIDATLLVLSRKTIVKNALSDLLKNVPVEYLEDRLPRIFRFSFKIPFFSFFSFFHLTYPFLLPLVIKKKEYDFLVSHNSYTSFTAFSLSKINLIPYLLYVHDPISYIIQKAYPCGPIKWMNNFFIGLASVLDNLLVKNADLVLVQGDLHFNYLKTIMGTSDKLIFAPAAHDYALQLPYRRGNDILTVTAWKEGKELEKLIQIISEVKNTHLKIVGKWIHLEYRKKIDMLVNKLNLSNRVDIIGAVSEKKLNDFYKKARVVVIMNNERGLGLAALEAASNGCTFIIPSECGISRYFKDQVDGFYFSYGDTDSVKQYLYRVVNNERLAFKMGKHAWQMVKEKYSWKKHVKVILNCINKNEF